MSTPKTDEERAYERLRKAMINGDLPIGKFLSQRKLADIAGVSVITVRSALRILERDGIVENIPRWGVRIPVETEATLRDRYFIREVLEIAAVRRLVEQASEKDAQMLRELAQRCDAASSADLATFAEAHFELHHAIVLCSGSPLLVETLDRVFYRTRLLFDTHARLVRMVHRDTDKIRHVPLVEDLLSGNPALAVDSMMGHIQLGHELEREALHSSMPSLLPQDGKVRTNSDVLIDATAPTNGEVFKL